MIEEQYWHDRYNDEVHNLTFQNQSIMNRLVEQETMNLFSILKPTLKKDGNQWCVLYGDNLQEGICGFGNTPYLAIIDFNKSFNQP